MAKGAQESQGARGITGVPSTPMGARAGAWEKLGALWGWNREPKATRLPNMPLSVVLSPFLPVSLALAYPMTAVHAWIDRVCLNQGSRVNPSRAALGVHFPEFECLLLPEGGYRTARACRANMWPHAT